MYIMYDSVTVADIPANAHSVAAYVNGAYANHSEVKARFPHAHILTISVTGDVAADCYDIEKGDYTYHDIPRLFKVAADAGVWRPCFYADLHNMPSVRSTLANVTSIREEYRLWVASWDGLTHIPGGYDAKQFTDRALGRNLDESVCNSTFFPPQPPVAHQTFAYHVMVSQATGAASIERVS